MVDVIPLDSPKIFQAEVRTGVNASQQCTVKEFSYTYLDTTSAVQVSTTFNEQLKGCARKCKV